MALADMDLVRDYAARQFEPAFEELVSRHLNLVYSTALRRVNDPHLAEEITQAVFIILARKAHTLGPNTILPGWLHRTACFASADAVKTRRRRAEREQKAYMQSLLNDSPDDQAAWQQIAPLIDDAVSHLGKSDHDAIVLRFFENRNFKDVGAALGTGEAAAKMRVSRALEKLRKFLAQRGIISTTAIIAGAISAHSVQAAPGALAQSVTTVAAAKGATASSSTLTIIQGALKIMAWTKAKTAVVASIALILIVGGGAAIVFSKTHVSRSHLRATAYYNRGNPGNPLYHDVVADLRANVWPQEKQAAEAKIKARQETDETSGAVTVDLKPFINAALTDSPASPIGNNGNNLAELPSGTHIFGGVPFDVEGLIQLDGTNFLAFNKHFPAEVDGIHIDRKCAKIHILHSAHWVYRSNFGTTVAKLVIHYADRSSREIDIVAGQHLFDCWSPLFVTGVEPVYFQMAAGTERAWAGSNPMKKKIWPDESVVLYKSTFENPQPAVPISSIDYVSTVTGTTPFLVGLTTE